MKRFYLLVSILSTFFLIPKIISAQSSDRNYVSTVTVLAPLKDADALQQLPDSLRPLSVTYYDGLGRKVQTVDAKASPSANDVVTFQLYDALGRTPLNYLPYTVQNADASFRKQPLGEQGSFYQTVEKTAHTAFPYAESVFEASPLGFVKEQGGTGEYKQLGGGHTIKQTTGTNGAQEVIRICLNAQGLPYRDGFYPAGTLALSVTEDEHGRTAKLYVDGEGRTVLKETDLNGTPVRTAYVYDLSGRQRFVFPPEAMKDLPQQPDAAFLNRWAFSFRYDTLGRPTEQKMPGNPPVYTLYDPFDRPVLTQDGRQREKNRWSYVKYDIFNRPIITGELTLAGTVEQVRQSVEAFYAAPNAVRHERLGGSLHGYTNFSFPTAATPESALSVTYHDDYAFLQPGWDAEGHDFGFKPELDLPSYETRVAEAVTGIKIRVLGADLWLNGVMYYDDRGRLIQQISEHHRGGTDRVSTRFDFAGKTLERLQTRSAPESLVQRERYDYDRAGRPVRTVLRVNDLPPVVVSELAYNELGQAVQKKLYSNDQGKTFLQTVDYRYALQGALESINGGVPDDTSALFGLRLHYEQGLPALQAAPQFNGNMAAQDWYSKRDGMQRGFGYGYDALNRLTSAWYAASMSDKYNAFTEEQGRYRVPLLAYDLNGNITAAERYGKLNEKGFGKTDALTYFYDGNRMVSVNDAVTEGQPGIDNSFMDNGSEGNAEKQEYVYDANGNMTEDGNRSVYIVYNRLNLPDTVLLPEKRMLRYVYDAGGAKLRKELYAYGKLQTATDYIGGSEYRDDALLRTAQPEGTLRFGSQGPVWEFYYTDHLGNVRMVWAAAGDADASYLCTMEEDKDEEGKYPKFENVSAVRDGTVAKEGNKSAKLIAEEGPSVSIPVKPGERYTASVWYYIAGFDQMLIQDFADNPAPPSRRAKRRKEVNNSRAGISLSVMPVPQTAPRGEKDFSPPRFGITATLGLGRRNGEKRQAPLVPQQQDWQNNKAALNIVVYDSLGKPLKHLKKPALWAEGWHRLELKELIDSAALNGEIRVFVDNQGQEPVWFDSLYIEAVKPKKALIVQENHYDPYGNPVLPLQYLAETQALNPSMYQGKELDSLLQAYDFEARLYDPLTGRFMSSDPADQFASGYIGMGNNPVVMVDPDGEFAWFVPLIFGGVNLISQAIQNKIHSFSDGLKAFGIGALHGTMAALGAPTMTWYAALGNAVAGQLPGVNINIGRLTLGISPAFFIGSDFVRFGASFSASLQVSENVSIGASISTLYNTKTSGKPGTSFEARGGYGLSFNKGDFGMSLYRTSFMTTNGTGQTVGGLGIRAGDFSLRYENDWPLGDGGDKFRTAAMEVAYKDFRAGFKLFTGDPEKDAKGNRRFDKLTNTYIETPETQNYRLGAAYIGYKDYAIGLNSERIRHQIQNRIIHKIFKFKYFKVIDGLKSYKPYFEYSTKDAYSLW